jgi:HEAT repeat protein
MKHIHFSFLVAFALWPASVHADAIPKTAQQAVWEFERKLSLPREPDSARSKENERLIREFFSGLKDREMKIAAIGMMDSRYVYHIPKDLTAELLGKLIKDPDVKVRSRAAHAVGYNVLGHKHADDLLKLLKEHDPEIKKNVIYAMRGKNKQFLTPLKELLHDKDQSVRLAAAFALDEFPRQETAAAFRKLLDDKDDVIRATAVGHLPDDESEKFLDDRSEQVRLAALGSLSRRKGKEATKRLVDALDDTSSTMRYQALRMLGDLKAKEAVEAVAKLLDDKDVVVRRHAVMALEFVGGLDQADKLRLMLKDEDDQVREHAARILGLFNATLAAEDLIKLMSDEHIYVRYEAVLAVARIGAKKHADAIANCLEDKDNRVVNAALHGLGQSGDPRFLERLKSIAENSPDDSIRDSARTAIRKLMP